MRFRLLVAALASTVCLSAAAQRAGGGRITFTDTIAPIVYENCVTCHRPGEAAPFSLISYDDVRRRGTLIAKVTASRFMPPWHAAHGYGEFADERRLSDSQIAAIGEWVKSGMPQGDPSHMPKMPSFTDGWQLGTPDLILEMPEAFDVPAGGPDIYRNFAIPTGLTEDKGVRAIEFRPSTRKVVHHALFQYVRGGAVADLDARDSGPGFRGAVPVTFVPGFQPSGDLGGWAVGTTPRFLPEGLTLPLAKGSDLIVQLHLHPTGKPETERSTIGIHFADAPPDRKVWSMGLPGLFGLVPGIDIPPGEKNYTITGSLTLRADMRAFSIDAHAHYLGRQFKATATLPDGTTLPLLWIENWDFNWQDRYDYKQPLLLPKGTRIDVSITYDNSADNPRNPNNPPQRVQWGLQSSDEMGVVRIQMTTVRKEDEAMLQQVMGEAVRAAIAKVIQDGKLKRYQEQAERFRKPGG